MSTTHTLRYYFEQERIVFGKIPGMKELLCAEDDEIFEIETQYPDAAFALRTANNLYLRDRELSAINFKAYRSILQGENVTSVRIRYDKDMDQYLERHMWDD